MVLASRIRPLSAIRFASDKGKNFDCDSLVSFGLGYAGSKPAGQVDGHGFVEETGAYIEMQDSLPLAGGVAGFFEQLAFGGGERRFAIVDASGGQFPHHGLGGMAILALEQNAWLGFAL